MEVLFPRERHCLLYCWITARLEQEKHPKSQTERAVDVRVIRCFMRVFVCAQMSFPECGNPGEVRVWLYPHPLEYLWYLLPANDKPGNIASGLPKMWTSLLPSMCCVQSSSSFCSLASWIDQEAMSHLFCTSKSFRYPKALLFRHADPRRRSHPSITSQTPKGDLSSQARMTILWNQIFIYF